MLQKPFTIANLYRGFREIYMQANALTTIGGRGERLAFLNLACADLADCMRKGRKHLYPIALAQCFAWFNSLAEELFRDNGGTILTVGMIEKYPKGACGYCNHAPCVCREQSRNRHNPTKGSEEQIRWTLFRWQEELDHIYSEANRKRGIEGSLIRLFAEVAEIGGILHLAESSDEELSVLAGKIAREFTDVLAWLFAIASLLDINLEGAVVSVYRNGCPVCKSAPCACTNFASRPGSRGVAHRFIPAKEIVQIRAA